MKYVKSSVGQTWFMTQNSSFSPELEGFVGFAATIYCSEVAQRVNRIHQMYSWIKTKIVTQVNGSSPNRSKTDLSCKCLNVTGHILVSLLSLIF